MSRSGYKIYFWSLALACIVGAVIPASHPTPICDALLYFNAVFCAFHAVRA